MQVLTDAQWAKFEAAIAAAGLRKARARKEDRRAIEAIVWRLDNDAKWRSIPAELGDWHHAYVRFRRWTLAGRVGQDHGALGGRGGAKTGVCLHRWHGRAGAPEGGRRAPEQTAEMSLRLTCETGGDNQALGRSRGGFGSKIVDVCDAAGRLIDFVVVPGQAHELAPSLLLLSRLPKAPAWATEHAREGLANIACDAKALRSAAKMMRAIPVVPSRKNAKHPEPCPNLYLSPP